MSEKRVAGGPILTSCNILAEVGAALINKPVFSGTTEMEGRSMCTCVCVRATLSNPIYQDGREVVSSGRISLLHLHLYLTPAVSACPSLKLVFGQALDLWIPFLDEDPGQCSCFLHPLMI